MQVKFTQHAENKFEILKRHGFEVTRDQVEETLAHPDKVIQQPHKRIIAQSRISSTHVLRVVYRIEEEIRVVITFYPSRRDRYED